MLVKRVVSGERVEINSLEDALKAVAWLDCACHAAVLVKPKSDSYFILAYDGFFFYPRMHGSDSIERSDSAVQMEDFLWKLFKPYIAESDYQTPSMIAVRELPADKFDAPRAEMVLQLNMLLYLNKSYQKQAENVLGNSCDSATEAEAIRYCLD